MGLHTGARRLTPEEWEALSRSVFERDGWACLAPELDENAGPCRDAEGRVVNIAAMRLESFRPGRMRYVRRFLTLQHVQIEGKTEHDEQHLLSLCWGHHLGTGEKGGRIWSKTKEAAVAQRGHLIKLYPQLVEAS